ncbi:MAG: DUF177 domain-containing protein [candidate division KSB1 bacterium]|nr:DUF177 domain-containing protein [candidate division KSB1 bacterium]MDZ7301838.1 DUF177 domain-containing protein [candidate division KSB1 bacterium]MDZ7310221.1 DUF177 domain-containing protein [candidate division KSB1 bacterium]
MKISLTQLSEGLNTLSFVEELAELGIENHPNLREKVKVQVEIEQRAPHYFVKSSVYATGRFVCDRCASDFELSLLGESHVLFSSDEALVGMSKHDEIHLIEPDAKEIDITDDLRDTLLLAIPMKLLCSEDCRGLCAGCGVNLNEEACRCAAPPADSRWEALRQLL